jgi:hypothetical protein
LFGPWNLVKLPNHCVGFSLVNPSDSPFVLLHIMTSHQAKEWCSYRSLLMDGYIRDSREQYYLSRPNVTQMADKYRTLKWNGTPVTAILPALVSMQFPASAS